MHQTKETSHDFAIVIQPGLEQAAQAELLYWSGKLDVKIKNISISFGIIEFQTDFVTGLSLNQVLKCPTRIISRIKELRCRDFPKLFKAISKIDWQTFGIPFTPKWEVSTKQSRLSIKKRIKETCDDGFRRYLKTNGLEANSQQEQKIFIRISNDTLTVSIDTSGSEAFKRGIRIHTDDAPLRENIASALLWQMFAQEINEHKSIHILDPMTGSGCFPIEAASLLNPRLPQDFSCYQWNREILDLSKHKSSLHGVFIGHDINDKAIQSANKNKAELIKHDPEMDRDSILFKVQDFFKESNIFDHKPYSIIINPPYFQRIKVEQDKLPSFFRKLFLSLDQHQHATKAGIIVPKIKGWNMPQLKHWQKEQVIKTSNGGIPIFFYQLRRV